MKITNYSEYKQALSHIQEKQLPIEKVLNQWRNEESEYINDVFIPLSIKLNLCLCVLFWIIFIFGLFQVDFYDSALRTFSSTHNVEEKIILVFGTVVSPFVGFPFVSILIISLIQAVFYRKKSKGYQYFAFNLFDTFPCYIITNAVKKNHRKKKRAFTSVYFDKIKNQSNEDITFRLGDNFPHLSNRYCIFISSKYSYFVDAAMLRNQDRGLRFGIAKDNLYKIKNDRKNIRWCFYNKS